jgi:hypothetical protein
VLAKRLKFGVRSDKRLGLDLGAKKLKIRGFIRKTYKTQGKQIYSMFLQGLIRKTTNSSSTSCHGRRKELAVPVAGVRGPAGFGRDEEKG